MHSLENFSSSMSNLNIWDSPEVFHRNNIKNRIYDFAIKSGCFFLGSRLLTNRSSWFLPSVFNRVPYSFIYRFQEGFHPNLPIGIVILIKVWRNHKKWPCSMTIEVKNQLLDQESTFRSRDLTQELTCSDTTC